MHKRTRPLFAWIGVFIAAGGVFLFSMTVTVLSLKNQGNGSSLYFRVPSSAQMTLCYTNSMYNAPVEEVFSLRRGDMVLSSVRTASPAVMEYYGFEGSGPVQPMNRRIGAVLRIQTSMGQDQKIRMGDRTLDLHALGKPGDRIEIRVEDVSLASFLLSRVFHR